MEEYFENEMNNWNCNECEIEEPIEEEPKPVLFVLNLNEDNRILSACYDNEYIDASLPRVETLADGDLYEWLFVNGEYIYSPIVEEVQ